MRLDKFLKISRLIKRRTVAKEASDAGKITLNGKVAKASDSVKTGDKISIHFSNNETNIIVINNGDDLVNPKAEDLYKRVF